MTASEADAAASAEATSSPPFRIEPVPYTNYPGSYYVRMYRVACTDCGWHGPSRDYNYTGPAAHPVRPEPPRAALVS